jgi:hypothetical protein
MAKAQVASLRFGNVKEVDLRKDFYQAFTIRALIGTVHAVYFPASS